MSKKMRLTIKESILPQPPSFSKKKNYQLHGVLGTGTFGKVLRATWIPDPTHGVGSGHGYPRPFISASSVPDNVGQGDGFLTPPLGKRELDVALKVIPKKRVKGNESVVWGEMEVLRGLDHPNVVSDMPIPTDTFYRFSILRSNFMNGLSQGTSTICPSSWPPAASCLKEFVSKVNSQRRMPYLASRMSCILFISYHSLIII